MKKITASLAICVLAWPGQGYAADELCAKLDSFVRDQKAEKADPAPRHWVEFHWGIDPDPDSIWSWGCRHSSDQSSAEFCGWLMENTSREFRNILPIDVQKCMGFRFPSNAVHEWHMSDGLVSHQLSDPSYWLVLELAAKNLQPDETAVRLSVNTVDREFEPDDLPAIQPLTEGDGYRFP